MELACSFEKIIRVPEPRWLRPEERTEVEGVTPELYQLFLQTYQKEVRQNLTSWPTKVKIKSPTGKSSLTIRTDSSQEFCLGTIRSNNELICKIYRLAPFNHSWVNFKEKEYLITAEYCEGLTVINCTDRTVNSWVPQSSAIGFSFGFTMESATLSPNGNWLILRGKYGNTYSSENHICDFREPDKLPLRKVKIIDLGESVFETSGEWDEDTYYYTIYLDKLCKDMHETGREIFLGQCWLDIQPDEESWLELSTKDQAKWEQQAKDRNNQTIKEQVETFRERLISDSDIDDWNFKQCEANSSELILIYRCH